MTVYKCRRGHRFEIDDSLTDADPAFSVINPGVRAYCPFCEHKDRIICHWDKEGKELKFGGESCTWLRDDQSWADWDRDEEDLEMVDEWEDSMEDEE